MRFITVDPGMKQTGVAFVEIENERVQILVGNIQPKGRKNFLDLFLETVREWKPDFIVYEDLSYGGHKSAKQSTPYVLIELAAEYERIPAVPIPIMTWKSITIGTKAKKKEHLKLFEEKYGKAGLTIDEADAYMMADAMLKIIYSPGPQKPGAERALKKLKGLGVLEGGGEP